MDTPHEQVLQSAGLSPLMCANDNRQSAPQECYQSTAFYGNETHCSEQPCLAQYNLKQGRTLGQGGFGVVYAACTEDDKSCPAVVKASLNPLNDEVEIYEKASAADAAPRFRQYDKQCVMKDGSVFQLLITDRYDFTLDDFLNQPVHDVLQRSDIVCAYIVKRILALVDILYERVGIMHGDLNEKNIVLRCVAWREAICYSSSVGDKHQQQSVVKQIEADPQSMLDVRFIDFGIVKSKANTKHFKKEFTRHRDEVTAYFTWRLGEWRSEKNNVALTEIVK